MENKISVSVIDFQENYGDRGAIDTAAKIGITSLDFDLSFHSVAKEGELYTLGKEAVREYFFV